MELKWKIHEYTFKPASYSSDETRKIMDVHRGTLVTKVSLRVGTLFNGTATISIGDDGDPDGFMTTDQAAIGSAGLKNGAGVYLATEDTDGGPPLGTPANGKLYTGDDTIDLTYDYTADTDQGLCTVYIVYAEIE